MRTCACIVFAVIRCGVCLCVRMCVFVRVLTRQVGVCIRFDGAQLRLQHSLNVKINIIDVLKACRKQAN